MTHWRIKIYGASETSSYSSTMTRKIEAADLMCAAKQAQQDLETLKKIFPNLTWRLDTLEEVEAKP